MDAFLNDDVMPCRMFAPSDLRRPLVVDEVGVASEADVEGEAGAVDAAGASQLVELAAVISITSDPPPLLQQLH